MSASGYEFKVTRCRLVPGPTGQNCLSLRAVGAAGTVFSRSASSVVRPGVDGSVNLYLNSV